MITLGKVNRLTFEATGYKDEKCYSEWDDFLMLDIKYFSGEEIAFQYEFPHIMTKEFAGIAGAMRGFMEAGEGKITIDFSEPYLVFTIEKIDSDSFRVTAEIFMKSHKAGNTIVKNHWFDEEGFREFIDSIENESKKFPPRFE